MITAVDTSVLLDILTDSRDFGPASLRALEEAQESGRVVVCPVVWAERRSAFQREELLVDALREAGIEFDSFTRASATLAGAFWREYRRRGGRREHLIPDFLIAAHAQVQADALLTRDRGFSRRYFGDLRVVEPVPR